MRPEREIEKGTGAPQEGLVGTSVKWLLVLAALGVTIVVLWLLGMSYVNTD